MSDFDAVVFAGGGCRCFWQAGFYQTTVERMEIAPKAVAAASAGAALGCVAVSGLAERALVNFKRKAENNSKNFYVRRLLSGKPPFPHEALFRQAILETIDQDALDSIRSGPPFWVSLTRLPPSHPFPKPLLVAGLLSYLLEGQLTSRVHREWPARLGFRVEWARADQCTSIDELTDLLLQTSCTPPFTSALVRGGTSVFDGGLINNVPVEAVKEFERILVFLTRPNFRAPSRPGVVYVAPSESVPVEKWDYTNPRGLQSAFDLGRRDGEAFARKEQECP